MFNALPRTGNDYQDLKMATDSAAVHEALEEAKTAGIAIPSILIALWAHRGDIMAIVQAIRALIEEATKDKPKDLAEFADSKPA